MENLALKATGTSIPFYLTDVNNFTAHIGEAKVFTSVDEATCYIKNSHDKRNDTFQIVDIITQKWVAWINY